MEAANNDGDEGREKSKKKKKDLKGLFLISQSQLLFSSLLKKKTKNVNTYFKLIIFKVAQNNIVQIK